jgi:antitoxin VapB
MTEAIRRALAELKGRFGVPVVEPHPKARLMEFLERSAWPKVVPGALGHPITKQEEDEILGYGRDGF